MKVFLYCLLGCIGIPLTVAGQGSDEGFAEWLVQLAYDNYPGVKVRENEAQAARADIRLAQHEWLRAPGFNLGFNQGSTFGEDGSTGFDENLLFPRVSIGASLNLYPIVATKAKVKGAEATYRARLFMLDQDKVALRREVLSRYRTYELALELHKVRAKMEEDSDAHYRLLDRLFRANEVEFKDYNDAYTTYQASIEARLQAAAQIDTARIALEELIGMPLADARRRWQNRG